MNAPWTTRTLIILRNKPIQPTIKTRTGDLIGSKFTKRSTDWRNIDRAKASRKTPLKKAPDVYCEGDRSVWR